MVHFTAVNLILKTIEELTEAYVRCLCYTHLEGHKFSLRLGIREFIYRSQGSLQIGVEDTVYKYLHS